MNGALSDSRYRLKSNIFVSLEGITTLQTSLFSHIFLSDLSFFFTLNERRQFTQ